MTEVSCAIIIEHGTVLATRRSDEMPHPLKWEFPGGKLKPGENPEESIRREIREELGLEVEPLRRLSAVEHAYRNHAIRLIPLVCRIEEGVIHLAEHMEYRWIGCDDLDRVEWLDADREVLEMVRKELCQTGHVSIG